MRTMTSRKQNFHRLVLSCGVSVVLAFMPSRGLSGAYDSGSQGSSQQIIGMVASTVFGGIGAAVAYFNLPACFVEPVGAAQCALGLAGVMGVGMAMQSLANMNSADDQSRGTMADAMGTTYTPIDPTQKLAGTQAYKDFLAATEPLTSKGYKFDLNKGTVTTPDGKIIPADTLATPQGAAIVAGGMGNQKAVEDALKKMSPKTIQDALSKIDSKAQKAVAALGADLTKGFNTGGGGPSGGGGDSSGSSSTAKTEGLPSGKGVGGRVGGKSGSTRDPAQVAGLKKDYNGDPVGVAEDSIFEMCKRRYKSQGKQNAFLVK